jgi:hypothetical protein
MASAFDTFLQQAWADHADQPDAVALRLRTQTPAPQTSDQLAALSRLVVHVCGEHLGAFDDGRWRLDALRRHPLADAGARSALRVGIAALTLAEHGLAERKGFSLEELIRSEGSAAAICVGRKNTERAMALLRSGRERLAAASEASAAAHRPLAIACNNMLWELHERGATRSAADTQAMLDVAAACRLHWSQAGTWVEVERADYGLALAHLSADLLDPALHFARQCLAGCTQNNAPPYEHFFAHEALARVQHARGDRADCASHVAAAKASFVTLAASDQDACRSALSALQALAP